MKSNNKLKRISAFVKTMAVALAVSPFHNGKAAVEYSANFDWTIIYEADVLPGDSSAIQYSDGTTGPFGSAAPQNLNAELRDGYLAIDSVTGGRFTIDARQEERFLLDSDNGYTVEFRARLIETRNTTGTPEDTTGAFLQLNDGRPGKLDTVHLAFLTWPSGGENWAIFRAGGITRPIPIGSEFQTYTITALDGNVTLYINAKEVVTFPPWEAVERPEVWFGTLGGADHTGHFEIDYLKIYDGGAVPPAEVAPYQFPEPYWITALVEPLPRIVDFLRDAQEFLVSFDTVVGARYRVESRNEMAGSPNEPAEVIVGDGGVATATDDITGVDRRFYQVFRDVPDIEYEEEFEWDMRYEGEMDPTENGAVVFLDGSTGHFESYGGMNDGKYKVEDGKLMYFINFPHGAFEISTADEWGPGLWIDANVGYTVELRLRVDYSDHWGAASLHVNAGNWNQNHMTILGFVSQEIEVEKENGVVTEVAIIPNLRTGEHIELTNYPVGSGFNTYTLVGEPDRVSLFINGVEVVSSEDMETDVRRDFIWLGSLTSADRTSRFDVDYLRVYGGGPVRPVSP